MIQGAKKEAPEAYPRYIEEADDEGNTGSAQIWRCLQRRNDCGAHFFGVHELFPGLFW